MSNTASMNIQTQKRILLIDCIRAFAVFGVFITHMFEQFEVYWASPSEYNAVFYIIFNFIMGKSFTLLALSFGLSEYMLIENMKAKGENYYKNFFIRMLILLVIGFLHSILYRGDILQILAPLGLLFMFFDRVKNNKLIILLAIFLFLQPYLVTQLILSLQGNEWANKIPAHVGGRALEIYKSGSFLEVLEINLIDARINTLSFIIDSGRIMSLFGLFLIGLYLGRIGFFINTDKFLIPRRIIMFTCLIIAGIIVAYKFDFVEGLEFPAYAPRAKAIITDIIGGFYDVSLTLFYMLLIVDFYQNGAKKLMNLIAPVGRMTLSFYILQSIIFVPIFYDFGLKGYKFIPENTAIFLGFCFFILQIMFANFWFRYFYYGPLEWAWRSLTYFKLMPFKR